MVTRHGVSGEAFGGVDESRVDESRATPRPGRAADSAAWARVQLAALNDASRRSGLAANGSSATMWLVGYPSKVIGVIALALCGVLSYLYWHGSKTSRTKISEHVAAAPPATTAAANTAARHPARSNTPGSAVTNADQPAAEAKASATADADDPDKHAI